MLAQFSVIQQLHSSRLAFQPISAHFNPIQRMSSGLRTPVRKYREFRDSTKNSNFCYFFKKSLLMNYFRKKYAKGPARFIFREMKKIRKCDPIGPYWPRSLMEIMQNRAFSIFIFSRTETCLNFILGEVVIHL